MTDQPATCGKGLAANSALPLQLAELSAAMAELLEAHPRAVTGDDPASQAERDAYASLTRAYTAIASGLSSLGHEMQSYDGLPPAAHDMRVMLDGTQRAAFERVVRAKQTLHEALQQSLPQNQQMLTEMRAAETASGG